MTDPLVRIQRYDVAHASEAEQSALYEAQMRLRRERLPDDPPYPFGPWRANQLGWLEIDSTTLVLHTAIDATGRVLGYAFSELPGSEGYRHHIRASIEVLPDARRRGLGRALLREVVDLARRGERTVVGSETVDTQPSGEAALRHLGAKPGLAAHTRQLRLADLDRDLLRRWVDAAPRGRYRLERWDGAVPEAQLAAFIDINRVMADQPHGDLEEIREPLTPDEIREFEAYEAARGLEPWRLVAQHSEREHEGDPPALAGYTEVAWDPARPNLLRQGDTVVRPEHRGRGLGKWLKAAMLERVLAERPEVRLVRTGNADSNAPMLAINRALGFAPYLAETVWEVPLELYEDYLDGHDRATRIAREGDGKNGAR